MSTSLNVTEGGKAWTPRKKKQKDKIVPTRPAQGGTELQTRWLKQHVDNKLLDQFQLIPSRVRDLEDGKKRLLWLHDTPDDPESKHLSDAKSRKRFNKLIYVSNWQKAYYELYHGIMPSEGVVLKNAIIPIESHEKPKDRVNLIYHTTPHRGLTLLLVAFRELIKHHPTIHLDVFSSFSLYGWDWKDEPFQEEIDYCKEHPNITYHGAKPNEEIREALKSAHIFPYPSIWPETSCIAAMEAMSAGCLTVCPNFAALPETTANFAWSYNFNEDQNKHVNTFANVLHAAITHISDENVQDTLRLQKIYADQFYSWDLRAQEWTGFLKSLQNDE